MSSIHSGSPDTAPPAGLRRNVEIKASLKSLAAAREAAAQIATGRLGEQHQVDTYFVCQRGRLKLREIDGRQAHLISYERDDTAAPKASNYRIVPAAEPAALKAALAQACTIAAVVDKRREIFLHHNVRIHLDAVVGLGEFLEFEAVLDAGADEVASRQLIDDLSQRFGIRPSDLLPNSYADMAVALTRPWQT